MFADICCLIYECRHIANTLQSRSASTDEHKLSAVCVFALGTRLHWLPSGFILLVYLFKRLPMPPCSNYATAHGGISVFEFLSGCCICKQQQLMSSQVITVIICIITNSFNCRLSLIIVFSPSPCTKVSLKMASDCWWSQSCNSFEGNKTVSSYSAIILVVPGFPVFLKINLEIQIKPSSLLPFNRSFLWQHEYFSRSTLKLSKTTTLCLSHIETLRRINNAWGVTLSAHPERNPKGAEITS